MQSAVERWHELLTARAMQMDAAYARLGRTSADYWKRRARTFHQATKDRVTDDPFFQRVQRDVTQHSHVLDVGAGTGRFALAFAPLAHLVTAVEPNETMLGYLRRDATAQHIENIAYVQSSWEDAPADLRADVVICSHVLYPIWDIQPFLTKLHNAAQQVCYIYMRVVQLDTLTAHLWQHFHGDKRCLMPSYINALDVLDEMGLYPDVEIVSLPPSMRFPSLDDAIAELTELLILPDDQQTQQELRSLVDGWLVEQDGMLMPPNQQLKCAIIRLV